MKSVQKGFTLIELMIVVAIIAILAAIAIPQYQAYVARSQVTRVINEASDQKVVVEDCLNNGLTKLDKTTSCAATATASDLIDATKGPAQDGETAGNDANAGFPQINLSADDDSTIVATLGDHASQSVATDVITLTRDHTSGSWNCSFTATVAGSEKYAPASCPVK